MKNANSLLEVSLCRNMSGKLEVVAETAPAVEELMKSMSSEETADCFTFGRTWQAARRPTKTVSGLNVYIIPARNEIVRMAHENGYDLWSPGDPMHSTRRRDPSGRAGTTANLSFLRIVGISQGPVTFSSDEMLTRAAVDSIGRRISTTIRSFFDDHLREHSVNVSVLMEN